MKAIVKTGLSLALVLLLCNKVSAQSTYYWIGGSSGSWNNANNWSGGSGHFYPGQNSSADVANIYANTTIVASTISIASINIGNNATATLTINGNFNVSGAVTVNYNCHHTFNVGSGFSLAIGGGAIVFSQSSLTFAGSGISLMGGSTTLYSPSYLAINSAGTLNFASGSTIVMNSLCYISNSATCNATTTTFNFGSGSYMQNNSGGTFTTQKSCVFNINMGPYDNITNSGNWNDHTSTYNVGGQYAAITNNNTGVIAMHGTTINFLTGYSSPQSITNAGTFLIDSVSTINCATGNASSIKNTGTMYTGTSNSSCIINLTGPGTSLSNSGTFFLGSTSVIYPSGNASYIKNTGSFTLQSDGSGSAAIGPLNSSAYVSGTFAVERYFQGSTTYDNINKRWLERDYRILSSPVYTANYSGNNVFGLNYIVGSTAGQTASANSATNAFITGCQGGSTSSGNPSLFVFKESLVPSDKTFISGNFLGITNITNSTSVGTITCSDGNTYSLPVGNGVLFFFRGQASNWAARTATPYIAPENVTLTSSGYLNTFNITVKDWYNPNSSYLGYTGSGTGSNYAVRGFNMVGNPYPCTIDWCTAYSGSGITRSATVNPTIYEFDPITRQYATFIATSSSGGIATGNGSRYIMSGQGFIVQASGPGAQLTFTENAKAPGLQNTGSILLMDKSLDALHYSLQNPQNPLLRLKLSIDSNNYDDLAIVFNAKASPKYSPAEDVSYLKGEGAAEGISTISADGTKLSINSLPLPGRLPSVVPLSIDANYSGLITLRRTQLDQIPKLYEIWLKDKLKGDSLDMRNNSTYVFNVNASDTSTYGDNRFELLFRQNAALMVHLLGFSASKASAGTQVSWTTENEDYYTNFALQRSNDGGATFATISGFLSSSQGTYSSLDGNPKPGANAYRLQITDLNGNISYSNVITLIYGNLPNSNTISDITVYPNPARTVINLTIHPSTVAESGESLTLAGTGNSNQRTSTTAISSAYRINIVTANGLLVRSANTTDTQWQQNVGDLMPGSYIIKVINTKNNSLVGTNTFVKL